MKNRKSRSEAALCGSNTYQNDAAAARAAIQSKECQRNDPNATDAAV